MTVAIAPIETKANNSPMPRKRAVFLSAAVLFLLALTLRLAYVNTVEVNLPFRADAGKYFTLAINLTQHHAYSLSHSEPFLSSTYITPGYPLFLAIWTSIADFVDQFYRMTLNSQALLGACSVVIVFLLGLELGGLGVALVAGILFAISPHHIIAGGYVLTECLFTFLLLLSMLLTLRAVKQKILTSFWIAGLAIGMAALVRPVLLLLPLLLLPVAWTMIRRQIWSRILILCIGMALVWIPWQAWKGSHPAPSDPSQILSTFVIGSYPDLIYKTPSLRGYPYREDRTFDGKDARGSLDIVLKRARAEPARYLYWYLVGKPLTFLSNSTAEGQGGPYIYPVLSSIYDRIWFAKSSLRFMMDTHFLWALLAVLTSCWALLQFARGPVKDTSTFVLGFSALIFVYFVAVHSVLLPLARYAYPIYPLMYLLAAFGIQTAAFRVRDVWRSRQIRSSR